MKNNWIFTSCTVDDMLSRSFCLTEISLYQFKRHHSDKKRSGNASDLPFISTL